jgi:hypothetical protein
VFPAESKVLGCILLLSTSRPTFLGFFFQNLKFVLNLWPRSFLLPHLFPVNTNYTNLNVSVQNINLDFLSLFSYTFLLYLALIPYITPTALRPSINIKGTGKTMRVYCKKKWYTLMLFYYYFLRPVYNIWTFILIKSKVVQHFIREWKMEMWKYLNLLETDFF